MTERAESFEEWRARTAPPEQNPVKAQSRSALWLLGYAGFFALSGGHELALVFAAVAALGIIRLIAVRYGPDTNATRAVDWMTLLILLAWFAWKVDTGNLDHSDLIGTAVVVGLAGLGALWGRRNAARAARG